MPIEPIIARVESIVKGKLAMLWLLSAVLIGCGSDGSGDNGPGGNGSVGDLNGQVASLQCSGTFYNLPASVNGVREFEAYNALGDGYLRFTGTITTSTESAPMTYEDYSNLAPYEGSIRSDSVGIIAISVLDATGPNNDTMIIYSDIPTLGPPDILGEFTCVWF